MSEAKACHCWTCDHGDALTAIAKKCSKEEHEVLHDLYARMEVAEMDLSCARIHEQELREAYAPLLDACEALALEAQEPDCSEEILGVVKVLAQVRGSTNEKGK